MITFTKICLRTVSFSFFMINLTIIAMDYSQLQLQKLTNQDKITRFDCSIMITEEEDSSVLYATKKYHDNISLPSKTTDPLVVCNVIQNSTKNTIKSLLPAKCFFNLNTNSTLSYTQTTDPSKNKRFLINATCKPNPQFRGNNFMKQFKNAMIEFFYNPAFVTEENSQELENAGVIASKIISTKEKFLDGSIGLLEHELYIQGINGCSSEKIFIESIIDEKTSNKKTLERDNLFSRLRYRELNGCFK